MDHSASFLPLHGMIWLIVYYCTTPKLHLHFLVSILYVQIKRNEVEQQDLRMNIHSQCRPVSRTVQVMIEDWSRLPTKTLVQSVQLRGIKKSIDNLSLSFMFEVPASGRHGSAGEYM